MSDSDHTATGQALGYVYQFDRATYRLLESDGSVVSVGLEHIDDVSVHCADGTSVREQDKATINPHGRPLTDRSVALWKTLAIWADAVMNDCAILSSTEFHLVTNGEMAPNCLAARIHAAQTQTEKTCVATELLTAAADLRDDLQCFGEKVRAVPPALLSEFIGKVAVMDKVSASFGGDLARLPSLRLLGNLQRITVFDGAVGWVRRTVLDNAKNGEPSLISRAAFDHQLRALFRHVAVAPLTTVFEPDGASVDPANYSTYGFCQQLDWIDTDAGFVRDCVIHYVQAHAARVRWTDTDTVSEPSLRAYEEDLKARWKLKARSQHQRNYPSVIAQGQELLNDTLSEDSVLEGQMMPKAITCGNFHRLANFDTTSEPQIGWHPEFKNIAKASKGKS